MFLFAVKLCIFYFFGLMVSIEAHKETSLSDLLSGWRNSGGHCIKKKKTEGRKRKGGMRESIDSGMWVSYVPVRNKRHSITMQSCLTSHISCTDDHSLIHALICGFYASHSRVFSL